MFETKKMYCKKCKVRLLGPEQNMFTDMAGTKRKDDYKEYEDGYYCLKCAAKK